MMICYLLIMKPKTLKKDTSQQPNHQKKVRSGQTKYITKTKNTCIGSTHCNTSMMSYITFAAGGYFELIIIFL